MELSEHVRITSSTNFFCFVFCSPLQRTGVLSLPQRTGLLPLLPRHLTGVVPLLTGLKSLTLATIKVCFYTLTLLFS